MTAGHVYREMKFEVRMSVCLSFILDMHRSKTSAMMMTGSALTPYRRSQDCPPHIHVGLHPTAVPTAASLPPCLPSSLPPYLPAPIMT